MREWEIFIQDRVGSLLVDIFIYRRWNDKLIVWDYKSGSVVEEKTYDFHDAIPATLTIPNDLLKTMLDAIIKKGVKPTEESFLKGKLESTENHLKDLRSLLKLK